MAGFSYFKTGKFAKEFISLITGNSLIKERTVLVSKPLAHVLDALDVETFLVCTSEAEGKYLALGLMKDLGFKDADVVFISFQGAGARVRVRTYVNRPGDNYAWLAPDDAGGEKNGK